jgi:hypothetical protein
MRWAGWLLAFWVACGGSGGGGGGSNVVTDGGAGTDGGVAPECAGLVPAPPGVAIAFDVLSNANDPMICGASTVDGAGSIVVSAPTQTHPAHWVGFNPNGAYAGTFDGPPAVFPQPEGFLGVSREISFVILWTVDGGGEPGNTAATAIGPAFGSGAVALSADSSSLTVSKVDVHDAQVNEVASATIAGTFTPRTGAEDSSGAVLALTGSGSAVSGIWVDMARQTAGQPFAVGTATSVKARPLLGGGIAIQLDGRWAGVARPGESTLRAAPGWLGDSRDFISARGGNAYAVMPNNGNVVAIVSAQGNSCGSVAFPGVTAVSVGIDGTVVGSTGTAGCTKYVWRNTLR